MKAEAVLIRSIFLSSVGVLFLAGSTMPAQVLVVTNFSSNTASVLDSFSGTITKTVTVPAGAFPLAAAINPAVTLGAVDSDNLALPPAPSLNRIDFYNLTDTSTTPNGNSVTLTGTFNATQAGRDITFSQDGACVIVAHGPNSGGEISSVNVATRTEVLPLLTGVGQRAVATVPGHPHLVLSAFAFMVDILNLDPTTCALTDMTSFPIPGLGHVIQKITVFPNGQGALLADGGDGEVHVLSISGTGTVSYVQTIIVGDHPQSIAITPNGRQAFVFKADTGKLRILGIDLLNNVTDTGTEITVPANTIYGYNGFGLVVTDGTSVFTSNFGGGSGTTITEANIATLTTQNITVGTGPLGMAYGGHPPAQIVASLMTAVNALPPLGWNNSLIDQLQAIQASLLQTPPPCGQIQTFEHEVQAQSGKKLTLGQADQLLGFAQNLATTLGCP